MRRAVLVAPILLGWLATRPALAQCSHTGCPVPAAAGTEPCTGSLDPVLEQAARNELGSSGPAYRQIDNGCNKPNPPALVAATAPCAVMKAIAQAESAWQQFCSSCGGNGLTLISFDCGYGIAQITSGMGGGAGFDPARVAAESAYNCGTGAKILMDKWAATPCVGDNNPQVAEDWYMAIWAYNSFSWVNNPNNPNFPASRPTYHGPGSLSRSNYPYQEIVLGYAAYPPLDNGALRYQALPIGLPDRSQICNTSGCRVQGVTDPQAIHCDECQRGNAAVLLSATPAGALTLAPGASGAKTFTLQNTGKATWSPRDHAVVHASGAELGLATVALPRIVAPGETVDVPIAVTAGASSQEEIDRLEQAPCAFGPELSIRIEVTSDGGDGNGSNGDGGTGNAEVDAGQPCQNGACAPAKSASVRGGCTESGEGDLALIVLCLLALGGRSQLRDQLRRGCNSP